jgi:hypothetical protein
MYLAHFGPSRNVRAHFAELRERLYDWARLMVAGIRRGETDAQLAADLARHADERIVRAAAAAQPPADDVLRRYEIATNYLMSAQGYVRYYHKHHPELLSSSESSAQQRLSSH